MKKVFGQTWIPVVTSSLAFCGGGDIVVPVTPPSPPICTPATTCPSGQNCGTAPDGCGGTLICGTCGAPQTCGGGGTANVCGCTPVSCPTQALGSACGAMSDGCGSTLNCDCAAGQTCASNVCTATCSKDSLTVKGTPPTFTPTSVMAGGTVTMHCPLLTYQLMLDGTVVLDLFPNSASKEDQQISCGTDGTWQAPNGGGAFNQVTCMGGACKGCAAPQSFPMSEEKASHPKTSR